MPAIGTKRTLRDQFSNAILHSLSDRPLMTQSRHYRASRIYLVFAGGGRTFTGTAASVQWSTSVSRLIIGECHFSPVAS